MLDQLLESFKGEALSQITSKLGLSESEANNSVNVVGEEIQSSVSNQLSLGNIGGIMNMFQDADGDGVPDALEGIGENVIGGLTSKLGFSAEKSKMVSDFVIPMAVKYFGNKMGNESKSGGMDMSSIISQFAGGGSSDKGSNDLLGGITKSLGGLFN